MSFTDTRDHAGPQEAIDAAGVSGKGTVLLDADTTYLLNPGLTIQKPVGMEGHGPASALQINVSSSPENKPVVVSPVLNAPYTASGALSAGDRVLALNSVMGLSVGDEVFLTLGEDPHDPNEEITRMFNSVEAIAGMDVTFALPFPEDIPSATHEVRTFNALPEGIKFSNFSLTRGPGISSDQGLHIAQCRNISAENITGNDLAGATLHVTESENISARNIYGNRADGSIHSTSGRFLTAWGVRNCRFESLTAKDIDGNGIFVESQCRNVVFDTVLYERRAGLTPGIPGIDVRGGSTGIVIKNYTYNSGTPGPALFVTQGAVVRTESVTLLNGNTSFPLLNHTGSIGANGKDYGSLRYHQRAIDVPASVTAFVVELPDGIYKSVRINPSSVTGITAWRVYAGTWWLDVQPDLITGSPVSVGGGQLNSVGSNYLFNNDDNKFMRLYTDATVPAGTTAQIELEYWEP